MEREMRNHCPRHLVFLTAPIALVVSSLALADGGFIAPYGDDIWEPTQKALVLWDQEAGREELVLQVDFIGETKDFAWIVPVPSLPDLDTAEVRIFWDCSRLTSPVHQNRGSGWGCNDQNKAVLRPGEDGQNDITIYDQETVGPYQTLTLGAENAGPLADSLQVWGYLHEMNRAGVEEALQFYIDKSWYFVAMRMDSSSGEDDWREGYWYGGIDPIRLGFDTSEPVYPLRISAISAQNPSEILLYVCAPHRMTFPGAEAEYANNLDDREFTYIKAHYRDLGPVLQRPCFITKLRKSFTVDEMSDDLFLERAATNEEFRQIYYSGLPAGDPLLLAMTGAFFVVVARVKRRRHPSS